MADRVPIGPFVGQADSLVDVDLIVASLGRAARISRLWLARSGSGAGALTASLRNATGGGGSALTASFGAGDFEAQAVGSLAASAAEKLYLRISAADAISQDLRGWFEVEGAAGVTTALTTLARVKAWRNVTTSTTDDLLSEVIAGVSARMQSFMGRAILAQTITAELHDGPRGDTLTLRAFPVLNPLGVVVRERGVVVDPAEYQVLAKAGQIVMASNGESGAFERGRLNYEIDYEAGYDEVPEDLAQAATRQAGYVSLETPSGNVGRLGNRGTVLESGGTSEYVTTEWLPGVLATLEGYRDRRFA